MHGNPSRGCAAARGGAGVRTARKNPPEKPPAGFRNGLGEGATALIGAALLHLLFPVATSAVALLRLALGGSLALDGPPPLGGLLALGLLCPADPRLAG